MTTESEVSRPIELKIGTGTDRASRFVFLVWDANPSKFVDNSPTRNLTEVWQARHDTQVGRWVTVFKAQWSPYPDIAPHIMVGIRLSVTSEVYMTLNLPLDDRSAT
jgi:hypothetical protein